MLKQSAFALCLALSFTANMASADKSKTPEQIIAHHMSAMQAYDLDAVMADYADDVVVVFPHGIFVGREQLREMFAQFFASPDRPTVFQFTQDTLRADVIIQHGIADPGTIHEMKADDIFVIRDGKITFQTAIVFPQQPEIK